MSLRGLPEGQRPRCIVEGCEKKYFSKEMCRTHYNREWRDKRIVIGLPVRGTTSPEWKRRWQEDYSKRPTTKALACFHAAKRRDGIRKALSVWADQTKMQGFYDKAQQMSRDTGIDHHVDHIVPINSKLVCGLHNEFNLQILEGRANMSKGNRFAPIFLSPEKL